MTGEQAKPLEPYKGLRPYEEENREIFFGRAQERDIIVDKLLSNKLTLLFAASGVGKSSLLMAAVIPGLKQPGQGNLGVVYFNDWVPDPIIHLKNQTLQALETQGKLRDNHALNKDIYLHQFFRVCSAFAGERLVVILDQFEEFFQNHKYKKGYRLLVEELSWCFKDKTNSPVFVVSMREDYALELNVFKQFMPTTLFANFFRLEKLEKKRAEEAVRLPVERLGFRYEGKLLVELLNDLAQREKESQLGDSTFALVKDAPAYVEPPYLQIVCTGLWDLEKSNPDKTIRLSVYEDNKRAEGFVDSYFKNVMNKFSHRQKKIVSRAFDHLVTPRGTKIAYTLEALNHHLKIGEDDLECALEKLRESRILRSKKREDVVWYELYHDVFSSITYQWNEQFKKSQRTKQVKIPTAASIILVLAVLIYYLFLLPGGYLLYSHKDKESEGRVELYKVSGKLEIKTFVAETVYQQVQFAADRQFQSQKIVDYQGVTKKLIGRLPEKERISGYYKAGDFKKAFSLVKSDIKVNPEDSEDPIDMLASFGSLKKVELLEELVGDKKQNDIVRIHAVEALVRLGKKEKMNILIDFMEKNIDKNYSSHLEKEQRQYRQSGKSQPKDQKADEKKRIRVLTLSAEALGAIGSEIAEGPLIEALRDSDSDVRGSVVSALGAIGSEKAVGALIEALNDNDARVRSSAADALGEIGSEKVIDPLTTLLNDRDYQIQRSAVIILGKLSAKKTADKIKKLLKNQKEKESVRLAAAATLTKFGDNEGLKYLAQQLSKDNIKQLSKVVEAISEIPSEKGISLLLEMPERENLHLKKKVITTLGNSKDKSVLPYLKTFRSHPQLPIQKAFVEALGKIDSRDSIDILKEIVEDTYRDISIRLKAISGLGNILKSEEALEVFMNLLDNKKEKIRLKALSQIGKIKTFPEEPVQLLKERLKKKLNKLVKNKARWRDNRTEPEEVKTQEAMEFQLAFVIARIDRDFGVELLSHELANVRQGAWMALGELREVSLIKKLSQMIRENDRPWFRYAAYRAVDNMLTNIETSGGQKELDKLEAFSKLLPKKEPDTTKEEQSGKEKEINKIIDAIRTRTQWTICQLEKRLDKQRKK